MSVTNNDSRSYGSNASPPSYHSVETISTESSLTHTSSRGRSATPSDHTARPRTSSFSSYDPWQNHSDYTYRSERNRDQNQDEQQPLLAPAPARTSTKTSTVTLFLNWLLLIIVTGMAIGWGVEYSINTDRPSVRDSTRAVWARDEHAHSVMMDEWAKEDKRREVLRNDWNKAVAVHTAWAEGAEKEREKWDAKVGKYRQLEHTMERRNEQWAREEREHNATRRRQVEEDDTWNRKDEKRREEEEERHRAGMFWAQLGVGKCESYGKRRYWSTLQHIPWDYSGDKITACMKTPVRVHGRDVKPLWCDDLGKEGVWGNWVIDFDEPGCTPRWNKFQDNGCTASGSGLREVEHHLEHFSLGEAYDWRDVCIKAPATIYGKHYDGPDFCENWGGDWRPNIFGYWRIEDESCL